MDEQISQFNEDVVRHLKRFMVNPEEAVTAVMNAPAFEKPGDFAECCAARAIVAGAMDGQPETPLAAKRAMVMGFAIAYVSGLLAVLMKRAAEEVVAENPSYGREPSTGD